MPDELTALAERQHGLVARRQVREVTGSHRAAARAMTSPLWVPVTDEVLRRAGAPRSRGQDALAAVLDVGGDSALSHLPGAAWWGVAGCAFRPLHVTTTRNTTRPSSLATVHRVRRQPPRWTTNLRGVPVVCPELLALQLFAVCREERAERLVERLWSMRVLCGRSIAEFLDEMGARGRNGTAGLRRYLRPRGIGYVPPATSLETRVMQILREHGIDVRRQVNSGGERWTGRVDFRHRALPLLIEAQSELFHLALVDRKKDAERLAQLRADGFEVVEVWDNDVWARPWTVVRAVADAIRVVESTS